MVIVSLTSRKEEDSMVMCYGSTETLNQNIARLMLFFASTLTNAYWQMSRVQANREMTG